MRGVRDVGLLRELAEARGGCFTRADASSAGWSEHYIRQAVGSAAWTTLHAGVFVETEWYSALTGRPKHLVDLHARLLVRSDGWCAARRSAAVVHDLALLGRIPDKPLLVCGRVSSSDRGYVRHERINTLPASEVTEIDGIRVTTLARTVVDVAREGSFRGGLVVAEAALRAGMSWEELVAVADRCRGWPGAATVKEVMAYADGRSESALESISTAAFVRLDVPLPEPQVEIWWAGELVARVDFLWREANVIGEADGRDKYTKVQDFYLEKRREERLRDLGFEVIRWDWDTAYHASPVFGDTLRRAFARGTRSTLAAGLVLRSSAGTRAAA